MLKANGFVIKKHCSSYTHTFHDAQWEQYFVEYNEDYLSVYDSNILHEVSQKEKEQEKMDEEFWDNLNIVG
jgi:hypothetical protein